MDTYQKKLLRQEYNSRINRVLDYIENNISNELKLDKLASVASFSPYHFHRIFSAIVGETLNSFIKRVRIEKAASTLISNPKYMVTQVALKYGFSSPANFSRAFRDHYGMNATEYRNGGYLEFSKNRKKESNRGKENYLTGIYINNGLLNMKARLDMDVEVKDMQEMDIVYVRHIGPYKGDSELFKMLSEKLFKWAGPRNLLNFPETKYLIIYHDDPNITDDAKLRTSVCITVPEETEVDRDIGKMKIPSGKYAIAHFNIDVSEYQDAWNSVYGKWMPESGYQPDDGPCYELYPEDCSNKSPDDKCRVDIYVPVKPL